MFLLDRLGDRANRVVKINDVIELRGEQPLDRARHVDEGEIVGSRGQFEMLANVPFNDAGDQIGDIPGINRRGAEKEVPFGWCGASSPHPHVGDKGANAVRADNLAPLPAAEHFGLDHIAGAVNARGSVGKIRGNRR